MMILMAVLSTAFSIINLISFYNDGKWCPFAMFCSGFMSTFGFLNLILGYYFQAIFEFLPLLSILAAILIERVSRHERMQH